jgi:hypothetical protein
VRNNIKVAQLLLEQAVDGGQATVRAISEAAGVHYNDAQTFMKRWRTIGWLEAKRGTSLLYTVTEQGAIGLARLIRDHAGDRDLHWPPGP